MFLLKYKEIIFLSLNDSNKLKDLLDPSIILYSLINYIWSSMYKVSEKFNIYQKKF